jgi:hypothetical protein
MRLGAWLGISSLAHGVFAVAMLALADPLERWARDEAPEPVTFTLIEPPAPPPSITDDAPAPPAPEAPPPPAAAAREPDRARPANVEPQRSSAPTNAPPPPASASLIEPPSVRDVRPPGPVDPDAERRRVQALIDPSRVARGGFDFSGGAAPSQRGAPAGLGAPDRGPSERDIEARLAGGLRAQAMTKTHLARAPFVLRRRSDGAQVWDGPRMTGVVRPDGTVEFNDRPNLQTNGFSASGTFDATEAIMGASGQDPLRAEREYFMRQTEELRERLEAEHRQRQTESGLQGLRGRLARVWATTERTTSARRRRIFGIWDEIDEDDEAGQRARRIILAFIRENLPAGSEDAYTSEEIQRFNAQRTSRQPFAPY